MTLGIKSDRYQIYKPLKQLSATSHDANHIRYLTSCEKEAIDFDKVKDVYHDSSGHNGHYLTSADALAFIKNHHVFIEFKSGTVKGQTKSNVCMKMRDSLLIYCDIEQKYFSYVRENVDFILVYDQKSNDKSIKHYIKNAKCCTSNDCGVAYNEERTSTDEYVGQPGKYSYSKNSIGKHLASLAGGTFKLFGLGFYEGVLYKNVYTFNEEEFNEFINEFDTLI